MSDGAATKLQSIYRRKLARKRVKEMKMNRAATKIQSLSRGRLSRHLIHINNSLFNCPCYSSDEDVDGINPFERLGKISLMYVPCVYSRVKFRREVGSDDVTHMQQSKIFEYNLEI